MEIINIYGKEYTCSKCNKKVNYGQCSEDGKTPVTKDKKPFNKKYGKESNVLSVAVNAGTVEIHPCYSALVVRDFDEITGVIKTGHSLTDSIIHDDLYDDFEDIVRQQYLKLNILSGKLCGEGATVKDKHITTMGLLHDYFSYLRR